MILEHKGIPIFYSDEGEGSVTVLLHGFLENTTMWTELIPEFSKSSRIVAIDLLGHGETGCIGYLHTMEMMAKAVKAVLDYLDIEEVTLIGHSMGGYVALAFADLFTNAVKGLCLMNSTALADTQEKQLNRDRAIAAVKQNHRAFISMSVSNLFAVVNRERLFFEIEQVKKEALKMPLQGIIAALEGMKIRKDRTELLHNATYKKMMIIGRKDPVLEYDTLLNQAMETNVEIIEFTDGHMSHIENKKELSYKIIHFIEK
jgi:pimeloyl-ACP methyl ester carboxylesterase